MLLGGEGGVEGGEDPPGTIRVTPEEKEAIDRLVALGFPKHRAVEAYLACDKNEEMAANYLFDSMGADDNYEQQVAQD
jgi:UV excision repair protein RAD23